MKKLPLRIFKSLLKIFCNLFYNKNVMAKKTKIKKKVKSEKSLPEATVIPKINITKPDPPLSKGSPIAIKEEAESIVSRSNTFSFPVKNPLLIAVIIIICIFMIGFLIIFTKYLDAQNKLSRLQQSMTIQPTPSQEEIKKMVNRLEKHMILPEEEPKVIVLNNVESLKQEQKFFSSAIDGDILYIYSQKVILYDPVKDKIKDIAQIRLNPPTETPAPTDSEVTPTISVTPNITSPPPKTSPTKAKT